MPITVQEALDQTSDNPEAYGLPKDAPDDQVEKARLTAAQALVSGTMANDAYWNSRTELEQILARAAGHGQVVRGEDTSTPTAIDTQTAPPAIESTAVEEPQTTAPVEEPQTLAGERGGLGKTAPVAPLPDNQAESIAALRAQVESLGGTPEA